MAQRGLSALYFASIYITLCLLATLDRSAAQQLDPTAAPPPTAGTADAQLCVTPCSSFRSTYMCTNASGEMIACDPTSGAAIASPARLTLSQPAPLLSGE